LLFLSILSASLVFGQVLPADTTFALPEVTVTATREATPASAAPQRIQRIGQEALASPSSRSMADVLDKRAAFFIRRYGPSGLAGITVRGSSPSQTLILVDGQRLSDPQLGQVDLTLLPVFLIDRVEVLYGGASALYGSDGMGAVVNLQTMRASAAGTLRFESTGGAFGERRVAVAAGSRVHGAGILIAAEADRHTGDFPYVVPGSFPEREERRINADRRRDAFFVSLDRSRTTLNLLVSDTERGLPGNTGRSTTHERQWDSMTRVWGSTSIGADSSPMRLNAFINRSALTYENTNLRISDTGRTVTGGVDLERTTPLASGWRLISGLSAGAGQAEHPSLASNARDVRLAAYASGRGQAGRILLYPDLRAEWITGSATTQLTAISPRLGANIPLSGTRPIFAKASGGRSFRAPTFNDRFWRPGGNPDLLPERSWQADAGVFYGGRRLRGEATVFYHAVRDQIVWLPGSAGYWAPRNLSRTRAAGLELSMGGHVPISGGTLLPEVTYVFTDARDYSDPGSAAYGQRIRFAPAEQAKVRLGFGSGPVEVAAGGQYVGRRNVTSDGSQQMPYYLVLDAEASLRIQAATHHVSLGLGVENLGGVTYHVMPNHPMPPRTARILFRFQPGFNLPSN
jgi:vitamin B12 transporter